MWEYEENIFSLQIFNSPNKMVLKNITGIYTWYLTPWQICHLRGKGGQLVVLPWLPSTVVTVEEVRKFKYVTWYMGLVKVSLSKQKDLKNFSDMAKS